MTKTTLREDLLGLRKKSIGAGLIKQKKCNTKPYTIQATSTRKFIDVIACSKPEAVKFIGNKGKFKEISARATKNQAGVYVFLRK